VAMVGSRIVEKKFKITEWRDFQFFDHFFYNLNCLKMLINIHKKSDFSSDQNYTCGEHPLKF